MRAAILILIILAVSACTAHDRYMFTESFFEAAHEVNVENMLSPRVYIIHSHRH